MSHLEDISLKVEQFYTALDKDLTTFQTQAKYSCIAGCSKCCTSPNIEASILELLPYAFYLYKNNSAEIVYDRLLLNNSPICNLYQPLQTTKQKGGCSSYTHRALICRLFGFSFTRNKTGESTLLTCTTIKDTYPKISESLNIQAKKGLSVPLATNYYNQLTDIDYNLSKQQFPINEAMRLAIEMILNHYHYSEPFGEDIKNAS
ncbi:YkgJ family cysteine cluster protein [Cytophaga aurantiaca]|uniref:YkgJ family cysteine cluster protein n=1 Tax=Cytophaga aurantiaca TaxID=29530 RepID=UPI00036ABD93|nr:YkgJ family cysteine cluster protein [Cytophaga aurantiaca]